MKTIAREELKAKLDRGENVKLIMALGQNAFTKVHIPGSLNFDDIKEAAKQLSPTEEVVVYCTTQACRASIQAYQVLHSLGFNKIYRYSGGLEEWSNAGYPLEGSLVQ
ncbi:MAG: rhodanese-like domain-containing protein [Anaerolineales bacterium]|jgi:rhodanese-related sulfurtransferase